MAYLGVLILRAAGFKGQISIGQYGLNHQFLFIEDLIVDPWAGFYCLNSMWKNNINAYGGSIKEGVMYGRLVSPEHDEMEDEEPEVVEDIPLSYNPGLSVDAVKVYLYRKNVEECHQAMPHFFTKK